MHRRAQPEDPAGRTASDRVSRGFVVLRPDPRASVYHARVKSSPSSRRSRYRRVIAAAALACLVLPVTAYAEEALASLLWLVPMAIAQELYFRLVSITPWLFGAMAISIFWHAFTGRDLIPFLFDTDTRSGIFGGRRFGFNLHRALAWATGFCTLYIALASMMMDPKHLRIHARPAEEERAVAGTSPVPVLPTVPPAPPTPPSHPAPRGTWPAVATYLVPNIDRESGQARIRVDNGERPAPVYVKLCRVVQDDCMLQRQFYLPVQTSLLLDHLVDGNYRLFFIDNLPPQFATGVSAVIRVSAGRAHEFTWAIPAVAPVGKPDLQGGFAVTTRAAFDAVK